MGYSGSDVALLTSCHTGGVHRGLRPLWRGSGSVPQIPFLGGLEGEVTVGDVIFTPAGENHLHGARKDTTMSHLSVNAKGSGMTLPEG